MVHTELIVMMAYGNIWLMIRLEITKLKLKRSFKALCLTPKIKIKHEFLVKIN